jgi:hypothetical protein
LLVASDDDLHLSGYWDISCQWICGHARLFVVQPYVTPAEGGSSCPERH